MDIVEDTLVLDALRDDCTESDCSNCSTRSNRETDTFGSLLSSGGSTLDTALDFFRETGEVRLDEDFDYTTGSDDRPPRDQVRSSRIARKRLCDVLVLQGVNDRVELVA